MPADGAEAGRGWWSKWGPLVLCWLTIAGLVVFTFTAPGILASSHPVRSYVLIGGALAELIGLTMALTGLYETWHQNAPGRHLYPWLAGLGARLRRRPEMAKVRAADHSGVAAGETAHMGRAAGKKGIPSLEEEVDLLRGRVAALEQRVEGNTQAIADEETGRLRAIETVRREQLEGDKRVESRAVELTVDGIPLAVTGLGVTILGVQLQAFAQELPS
jgi:hypothetical protein